ncbi:MAG TPA: TetR/AcrR family transcriptional regulator [Acidimicrobiales bacterium]|jgi:AcrR family transcriptional regulator
MVPIRQSAGARRSSVLTAAIAEFAGSGYAGTSTEAIAKRAGISQPYLFRLFGTKKDLFIATYNLVSARIEEAFIDAADGLRGEEAMHAMGAAYIELLQDPDLLQVQLHGFAAAAGDADIARACREGFHTLWHFIHERAEVDEDELRNFFAHGMLLSVLSAINMLAIPEPWAQVFCPDPEKAALLQSAGAAAASVPQPSTETA